MMSASPPSDLALQMARGVTAYFASLDWVCLTELPLSNSRRVDLIAMDKAGKIAIVEIKTSPQDFRSDSKWPEYLPYCDLFYFAGPPKLDPDLFPPEEGYLIADPFGADLLRPSQERKLQAARRKSVTLRFARAAASRLARAQA